MKRLGIALSVFVSAAAVTIATPARSERPTPPSQIPASPLVKLVCGSALNDCYEECKTEWTFVHQACYDGCERQYAECVQKWSTPDIRRNGTITKKPLPARPPKGKGGTKPPPKGGKTPPKHHRPITAAPIVNGKPVQKSPGTGTTQPILEKGSSSGGHGKH